MSKERLNTLLKMLDEHPDDSFTRYAVALEYRGLGDRGRAIEMLEALLQDDPGYVATYYQLGKLFEHDARYDDARKTYTAGIGVAEKANENHTADELREALDDLEDLP